MKVIGSKGGRKTLEDITSALCSFISTEVLLEQDPFAVTPDTQLIDGVLDSLGVMQVVSYVKDQFGVMFEEQDVTPENFQTVATIERLIHHKAAMR